MLHDGVSERADVGAELARDHVAASVAAAAAATLPFGSALAAVRSTGCCRSAAQRHVEPRRAELY